MQRFYHKASVQVVIVTGLFGIACMFLGAWIQERRPFQTGPAPFHFAQDEFGILVTPFVPLEETSVSQHIGTAVSMALEHELATIDGMRVRAHFEGSERVPFKHIDAQELGVEVGAAIVVWGVKTEEADTLKVSLKVTSVRDLFELGDTPLESNRDLIPLSVQAIYQGALSGRVEDIVDFMKAQILYFNSDLEQARDLLLRLSESAEMDDRLRAVVQYYLGHVEYLHGDVEAAGRAFHAAVAADSLFLPALVHSAMIQRRVGQLDEAIAVLQRVVASRPTDAAGFRSRGVSHFYLGETRRCVEDLNIAAGLEPDHPHTLSSRAWCHFNQNEPRQALADCVAALERSPRYFYALVCRGSMLLLGSPSNVVAGLQDLDQALEIARTPRVLNHKGLALMMLDRPGEAAAAFRDALAIIERDPWKMAESYAFTVRELNSDIALRVNFAGALMLTCQWEEARSIITSVIDRDPESPFAYTSLAVIEAFDGNPDAAFRALEGALELGILRFLTKGFLRADPDLETLRANPRFEALLSRFEEEGSGNPNVLMGPGVSC